MKSLANIYMFKGKNNNSEHTFPTVKHSGGSIVMWGRFRGRDTV